jgi:hypothetical protein
MCSFRFQDGASPGVRRANQFVTRSRHVVLGSAGSSRLVGEREAREPSLVIGTVSPCRRPPRPCQYYFGR